MANKESDRRSSAVRRLRTALALACLAALIPATSSRADLVIQIAPTPVQATPGSTGSFDIVIIDTGGSFSVGADTIELSLTGPPGVQFTGVDMATSDPYIFVTPGPPPFSFDTFPNTHFMATDSEFAPPFFRTLNNGDIFGLAHVSYSVDSSATLFSSGQLQFGAATNLANDLGDVPFTAINGTFLIVPEPSSLALITIGAGIGLLVYRRGRTSRRSDTTMTG